MQIKISTVFVDDHEKALAFYTGKLGFRKMADIAMGPYRWLTVVSPEGAHGVELQLESIAGFDAARIFQRSLYESGRPCTAFVTEDVEAEAQTLRERGVLVRGAPVDMGPIKAVMFEDGCGNLIHLVQPLVKPQ
ncbi:VOC family protein [Roseateles saccharophilus]|uniref:Catechol 2,3-dioxygenase-like lactoylglutathione lyase family enzyme n=1 Tax=Roseateles saccharophilus TaxID=304 RepID=A0A4R3V788_ROSSA|nr:VOC family protein [Roseateles saccharophilus]MDG0831659.1 VOC family protein [Roseateles saccharophilus]TCV00926.1 catechol 2,3-dioxygenase-like lactoylglutathione lyase family enzyme [Roseateles saccharophilus]